MASRKERQPIIPGGLNFLMPPDKMPANGSLLLDNWRVDQYGELRSRRGTGLEASNLGVGVFHTLTRFGSDRYAGIGTALWWGPTLATLVKDGFDSNPLGIAFFLGAGWVMNRNQQLRIKGSSQQRWGVPAPATPPLAAAGAQLFIGLEEFDGPGLPSGFDGGYYSGNTFVDQPASIGANRGYQVSVTNGSTTVSTSNTTFSGFLAGDSVTILVGELLRFGEGSQTSYAATIATVTDPTHLELTDPFPGATGFAVLFAPQVLPAFQIDGSDVASVEYTSTGALLVMANPAAPWIITDDFPAPVDTRTEGIAQDADVFRMWFRCDTPSAVDSFVISLFSGIIGDASGQLATATLPPTVLTAATNAWSLIQIARNVNIDALNATIKATADPTQLADLQAQLAALLALPHMTATSGGQTLTNYTQDSSGNYTVAGQPTSIDWSKITGMQIQVNLNAACTFSIDSVHFVGVIGGSLSGSGTYFVSFANADDEDGDLSPQSNTITCQGQSVALADVPISPDPQVTQRWIWRLGFTSSQALLVGMINDNRTTTFIDTMSVNTAQDNGVVAPTNRDLPPPARGLMGPYLSQLIAWNTDAHPCRYFWTPKGLPWCFPGANDPDEGNWEDAGSDDDPLVAVTNHQLMALFYKQRSLGRLFGSPDTGDYEQVDATVGLVGPKAVVNGGNVDYFMGPEGIYSRNYDTKTKISKDIDPIFKGDYVKLSNGEYLPPISKSWIGNSVLELCNDRLYVSYVENGQSLPSVTLICQLPGATAITDVPTYEWSRMKIDTTSLGVPPGFTALHYDGGPYQLMAGVTGNFVSGGHAVSGGFLYHLELGQTDGSGTIHVAWQSKFQDQGLPDNYKRYSDLELDFQTAFNGDGLSTLSVYIVYDFGVKVLLGTCNATDRTTQSFTLMGIIGSTQFAQGHVPYEALKAKNVSVRVEGDIDSTCIIYGAYLHWYPEERVATTFDTGFTDLGSPERVKQVDYLEIYATGIGQQVTRALYADLPGSLLTEQQSLPIYLPNGRGDVRLRLPSILEGRNLRMVLSNPLNSQAFQVHALRLRQRVIGEYIDGTIGEYFESPEFSVAPGRDGELKDLLLDYDSSGTGGQLVLYADSDPPGNALTVVRTLALPAGSRRTYVFPFEDSQTNLPYGTLFKIRIIPPVNGIVRLHGRATVRARIIGTSFDGSAGEIWLTQPLDMFGGIGYIREVSVVAQTGGPMTFTVFTELPNETMTPVATFPVNSTNTTNRLPISARLPGTTKGQLQQFKLSGPNWARLFEVKVLGRGVGNSESDWQWINVPLEPTPNEWTDIQMPVRATPEEFTWIEIPVDPIEE